MATNKRMNIRVENKHDIETNWLKATGFTPLNGEMIIYDADNLHSYPRIKIGNGVDNVNALPFIDKAIWNQFATINDLKAEDDGDGNITFYTQALQRAEDGEY